MLIAVSSAALLTACMSSATTHSGGPGMMGDGQYHYSPVSCSIPSAFPGSYVQVREADMGMTSMMTGTAPIGAHMMLWSTPSSVRAGQITFVVSNNGWRTHELVVLPLADSAHGGQRQVGADGKVDEAGSLGEASNDCAAGAGDGIRAGSAGWVTVTLPKGRYELVCNLPNHYTDGMHQEFDVT